MEVKLLEDLRCIWVFLQAHKYAVVQDGCVRSETMQHKSQRKEHFLCVLNQKIPVNIVYKHIHEDGMYIQI